jgi:hypothetical protein
LGLTMWKPLSVVGIRTQVCGLGTSLCGKDSRLGFVVARAVGRQLASRLPWGGLGEGM